MLNTPSLSPQESDNQELLLRKNGNQSLPESNDPSEYDSSDIVVKTEDYDYSLTSYEDIAAPEDIQDQVNQ